MYKNLAKGITAGIASLVIAASPLVKKVNECYAQTRLKPYYGYDENKNEEFFIIKDQDSKTVLKVTFRDGGKSYLQICNECDRYNQLIIQAMDKTAEYLKPEGYGSFMIASMPNMRKGLLTIPTYIERGNNIRESIRLSNINPEHPQRKGAEKEEIQVLEAERKSIDPVIIGLSAKKGSEEDFITSMYKEIEKRQEEKYIKTEKGVVYSEQAKKTLDDIKKGSSNTSILSRYMKEKPKEREEEELDFGKALTLEQKTKAEETPAQKTKPSILSKYLDKKVTEQEASKEPTEQENTKKPSILSKYLK